MVVSAPDTGLVFPEAMVMNHHVNVTVYRRYRLSSIGTTLRFSWCNVTLCRNCQQKHIC